MNNLQNNEILFGQSQSKCVKPIKGVKNVMACLRANFTTCGTVRGLETPDSFRLIPLTNIPMTIFSRPVGFQARGRGISELRLELWGQIGSADGQAGRSIPPGRAKHVAARVF